jgi:hypothetical protein
MGVACRLGAILETLPRGRCPRMCRSRSPLLAAIVLATLACSPPQIMSAKRDGGAKKKADAAPTEDEERDAGQGDSFFVVQNLDGRFDVVQQKVYCPGATDVPQPQSCATFGVTVDPYYIDKYTCFDLGAVPGVPPQKYGGLTLTLDSCSTRLLIGGEANNPSGKLYGIDVIRDANGHVAGFKGMAQVVADAPSNDGGISFGPDKVLFFTRWPTNELQQTKFGSMLADKVTPLQDLGVAFASASLNFVPSTFPKAGAFKMVSWSGGQFYTVNIAPDANGTFDVMSVKPSVTLMGGPEGFVYVESGNPLFPKNSMLVSEWSANKIATYETDDNADPTLATRKDFIVGLKGAEGAYRDPATGDFFFSAWGQEKDRVIVVRGFTPIVIQ